MKIKVGNKALIWCGTKLFPLYIYQRIPMFFLSEADGGAFISRHPFAYVWACLLITITIAFLLRPIILQTAQDVPDERPQRGRMCITAGLDPRGM